MSPPRRIAILGNAGTGKSTLADRIGRLLDLEVVHLDNLLWRPGWRIIGEDEFASRHAALLQSGRWVIEGLAFPSTFEDRLAAADLVILPRYALWRCYWWSLKRELTPKKGSGRPAGCPMLPAVGRLVRAIWHMQRHTLPAIERLLEQPGAPSAFRLQSPRDLPRLFETLKSSQAVHDEPGCRPS